MGEENLKKTTKLWTDLAKGNEDHVSESSSAGGSVSDATSEASDQEDMFKVEILPRAARTWVTEQDEELDRIAALAECLRDQPLLPVDPNDPDGLRSYDNLEDLDKGVHSPFVHCAFKNCKWCLKEASRLYKAPEVPLRLH